MNNVAYRSRRLIAVVGSISAGAFFLLSGCGGTTGARPDDGAGSGSMEDGGKGGTGGSAASISGAPVGGTPSPGASGDGGAASGAPGSSSEGGSSSDPSCSSPDELQACNPGPNQICRDGMCMDGYIWGEQGMDPLERGSGVLCLPFPNDEAHSFACMIGEWCLANELCRCGNHPGCQVGEQCLPACAGEDCADPNDYSCVREFACDEENLDACAAEPGQLCMSGAEECSAADVCAAAEAGAGQIACGEGADADCCGAGHWCFNQEQCRCGTGPACEASETCALNGIGFYECRPS